MTDKRAETKIDAMSGKNVTITVDTGPAALLSKDYRHSLTPWQART